ncbi:hypothetical protein CRG98_001668 [Punica granatum]|nr:hypothetical protein CRG98_001668 [Punica granatum]
MAEDGGLGNNLRHETVKRACHLAFKAHKSPEKGPGYLAEKRSSESIFSFAGCWSPDEWFAGGAGAFGEAKIDLRQFPCLRSISNDELAVVNQAFLTKFLLILEKSTLRREVMKALDDKKQIIFTGHSAGGPVAIFATIWLFEHLRSLKQIQTSLTSHYCLTFGSPLAADRIFCHAVRREKWSDHFVHFVMRYDIIPRVLLAPPSSMGAALPEILSFFNPNSRGPKNLPVENSALASDFFVNVLRNASCAASHAACTMMGSTNMLMDTISGFIELSPYRPFGTFVFCSGNGRLFVVKNPDAVLQLLFYSLQLSSEGEGPEVAKASLTTHLVYEDEINQNLGRADPVYFDKFVDIPLNSNDSIGTDMKTIDDALTDFGLGARARLCLRAAIGLEKQKFINQSKIEERKGPMQKAMSELEWYRSICETRGGYYDSFKQNKYNEDFKANVKRLELVGYLDEIVEMLKRYELPEGFEGQKEWVYLGTEFRRLVEPLDIANYYRHLKNEDTGPYIEKGRPRRYRYTQRWLEHFEQKPSGSRGESIIWAEVEELSFKAYSNEPFTALRPKIKEIEENLKKWLEEETVAKDALSEGSSLVKLWKDLRQKYNEVQDITGFISSG